MTAPIPVILDTDIGFDVDDMWALAFLLRCPELDLRLIVTENGDTTYATRLVARLVELAGRTDIPIGIGIPLNSTPPHHAEWVDGYDLVDYPGEVHRDGVVALIDTITASPEPLTVISIGPLPNIAAALQRAPSIIDNSRFVGMHGSLRRGYLGADKPHREYNVMTYPSAARTVFESGWDLTITPLDTCGIVHLDGERFAQLRASTDPLGQALIENHDLWCRNVEWIDQLGIDPATQSSTLYDTVAVYLAFAEDLLVMEELPIAVTDSGRTIIDTSGHTVRCATEWRDLDAFTTLLADRLLDETESLMSHPH
ncbi:MAG: nucleoside hydrolase [Acidimicrobiales bacterium]|nr:nucleoside hydrolase [Acidimicrobiales bacterium]